MNKNKANQCAITRAANNLHTRVKQWWKFHEDYTDKTLAVISDSGFIPEPGFIFCGYAAQILPQGRIDNTYAYIGLCFDTTNKKWCGTLDDSDVGICGIFERDYYGCLQGAVLAITGMRDAELASALGTKPHIVKSWYSGDGVVMPEKHLRAIVDAFLHNNACDCTPLVKRR